MEELQSKHRKEQKDLQGRINQKKKNATKKTRKGINDECDRLQRELRDRQQAETDALFDHIEHNDMDSAHVQEEQEPEDESPRAGSAANERPADLNLVPKIPTNSLEPSKKPNRQKARMARRAAEQEAQAIQGAEEAAKLPDLRKQEITQMQRHFEKLGFKEISIRPDGHCMYSAVAMLLQSTHSVRPGLQNCGLLSYEAVRADTARFVSEHPSDFESFLEEPIDQYTNKIKNTAEWGGQLELQAIAKAYGVDINVLQADGRIEKIESGLESETEPIWLTYYRHSFGLGEHYNALKKSLN